MDKGELKIKFENIYDYIMESDGVNDIFHNFVFKIDKVYELCNLMFENSISKDITKIENQSGFIIKLYSGSIRILNENCDMYLFESNTTFDSKLHRYHIHVDSSFDTKSIYKESNDNETDSTCLILEFYYELLKILDRLLTINTY